MAARKPNDTIAMTAVTEAVNSMGKLLWRGALHLNCANPSTTAETFPPALHNSSSEQCEPNNSAAWVQVRHFQRDFSEVAKEIQTIPAEMVKGGIARVVAFRRLAETMTGRHSLAVAAS
jgi:hypothetical protein